MIIIYILAAIVTYFVFKIGGKWINYDCTNGLKKYTWEQMIAYGNYEFLGYITPVYI